MNDNSPLDLSVPPSKGNREVSHDTGSLSWTVSQQLFQDTVFLRQMAIVLGVTLLVMTILFIIIIKPNNLDKLGQLLQLVVIVGGILLGLFLISILFFYGGHYVYLYNLNAEGIERRPSGNTARKNILVNFLLILMGKPTAMGTGLLAQTRRVERLAWKNVNRVVSDPNRKIITLYKGKKLLMVVGCDDKQFETVLSQTQEFTTRPESSN